MLRLPARSADRAASAEQRNGCRLVDKARRIGGDRIAVEPYQRERIVRIVDRRAHDRIDALADEPGVRTEHQHDRARGIRTRDEGISFGGFQGDHELS